MKNNNSRQANWSRLIYLMANPACLVGPAIWFQQTTSARLHRQLLKKAWPTRPRFQWYALLSISLLSWYPCFFWIHFYKCIGSAGFNALEVKGVGRRRQVIDLLYLGLWYGVKPYDYYVFSLYGKSRSEWLNYVFSQEQLTWHRVFSCPPESTSDTLVNDKYAMETMLRESGIKTTTTLGVLEKPLASNKSLLFQQKDLFVKPNSANAMRGCLQLKFDSQEQIYRLQGFDLARNQIDLRGEASIYEFLGETVEREKLLVQEVLRNSEEMSLFSKRDDLVTIKVISGLSEEAHIAYVLLEVPEQQEAVWSIFPVDTLTGQVHFEHLDSENGDAFSEDLRKDVFIPAFDQIKPMLKEAHRLAPDIKTLCWDICITSKGICIIEANTGWDLVSPQKISGIPLLSSGLLTCYL